MVDMIYSDILYMYSKYSEASVAILNKKLEYLHISDRWKKIFHLSDKKNYIGVNHYEVFPNLRKEIREIHKCTIGGEVFSGSNQQYLHDNGVASWLNWTCRPWITSQGIIGGLAIFVEDISEKYILKQMQLNCEEILTLFLDLNPSLMWIKDCNGTYVYISKGYEERFCISSGDVIGKTDFELWPNKMANLYFNNDKKLLKTKKSCHLSIEHVDIIGNKYFLNTVNFIFQDFNNNLYIAYVAVEDSDFLNLNNKLIININELDEENIEKMSILGHREYLKKDIHVEFNNFIKSLISPNIEQFKRCKITESQYRLISLVEENLKNLTSFYTDNSNLAKFNLSATELKIANMIREGDASKDIANKMFISPKTVAVHRANIRKKLNLRGKAGPLRYLLQNLR